MKRLLFLFLFFLSITTLCAVTLTDGSRVQLLTCDAGDELYSKFGHTAVRVVDEAQDLDWVFNYGIFDFNTDHFYYKFVKGETDYQLGVTSMKRFAWEYEYLGRAVYTQELNLTLGERQAVVDALVENYEPENRVYRYNFVLDNCATRPYYLIMDALGREVQAEEWAERRSTYRELLTHYTGEGSWAQFGIDLIFGVAADTVVSAEARLFLPEELMNYLTEATLVAADGSVRKVVGSEQVGEFVGPRKEALWASPRGLMYVLALLSLLTLVSEICLARRIYVLDALLYLALGVMGIIGFYLSFVSVHPLVQHNYNLWLMNPFMLVLFGLLVSKRGRRWYAAFFPYVLIWFVVVAMIWACSDQAKHSFIGFAIAWYVLHGKWYYLFVRRRAIFRGARARRFAPVMVIGALSVTGVVAQERPRLVVQVVVDGLRYDNLQLMYNYFPSGGLRTLMSEAVCVPHVTFPHENYGGVESTATICTGSIPYYHGVAADECFDRTTLLPRRTLADVAQIGIGTDDCVSPKGLLASTVADEVKLLYGSMSKVVAVGVAADDVIVLAGHAADHAVWMDDEACKWVSTGYYNQGFSPLADEMNMSGRFETLAAREWVSQFSPENYLFPTERERRKGGFRYPDHALMPSNRVASPLSTLPNANGLVVELALAMQEKMAMGGDIFPDVLSLHLTTRTPRAQSDRIVSAEQEEMYVRLNQDLGFLMEQLEKRVGKGQVLLMVVGRPSLGHSAELMEVYGVPHGQFNMDRAAALTNTYLMAIYGHERWVDGSCGRQIFLNKPLIEEKKMSFALMQKQVADFLQDFEGVQSAHTSTELALMDGDELNHIGRMRNSHHKTMGGDVVIALQPGWVVLDRNDEAVKRISEVNPTVPLFFWGMGLKPRMIAEQHQATEVAPTLSRLLGVAYPNACVSTRAIELK